MEYLQIRDDRQFTKWEEDCVKRLKCLLTTKDSYNSISLPHYDNILDTLRASDETRFEWLSKHPQGVYIDTDCYLLNRYVPVNNGKCFFPMNFIGGHIDIFLIYVNGNIKFIEENFCRKFEKTDKYGWPVEELFRLTKENIGVIDKYSYSHAYQSYINFHKKQRRAKCQIFV